MSEIRVVRARPDQWAAQREIRLEMLLDAPEAFATTYDEAMTLSEQDWRQRLTDSTTFWAVGGEGDGDLLGTVTMWDGPEPRGEPLRATMLVAMYVRPTARGTGASRALVGVVLDLARGRGLDQVFLHVTETKSTARRLYERCGFVETGRTEPHPVYPDLMEYEMVCHLSAGQRRG